MVVLSLGPRTQEVNFEEIWDTGVKITEEGLKNSSAKTDT